MELLHHEADPAIDFGPAGSFPTPRSISPRPRPVAPSRYIEAGSSDARTRGDRYGRGIFQGKEIQNWIDVHQDGAGAGVPD